MGSRASIGKVDSRLYTRAFALRAVHDFPEDFPITEASEGFRLGLFLPRHQESSVFCPARIVALCGQGLAVAWHPSEGQSPVRLALGALIFIESGRVLLHGWLRFLTSSAEVEVPYSGRDSHMIDEFLALLRHRYLPAPLGRHNTTQRSFGGMLDPKFAHAVSELDPGEQLICSFFSPAVRRTERRGVFRSEKWRPAEFLGVTDRRLLWITDCIDGRYERYGTASRYAPSGALSRLMFGESGKQREIVVDLRRRVRWKVPVPPEHWEDAGTFVRKVRNLRNYGKSSGRG